MLATFERAILCPAQRTPPEVLVTILLICSFDVGGRSQYLAQAPLNFSLVCRLWRDIALRTPEAWSTFIVTAPAWPKPQLIESWLARSQSFPLSLLLRFDKTYDNESDDEYDEQSEEEQFHEPALDEQRFPGDTWNILIRDGHRWRHLHLFCSSPDIWSIPESFPLLESATIRVSDRCRADWLTSFFTRAPRLRRLDIDVPKVPHLEFPWKILTHLKLRSPIFWWQYHDILTEATAIVEASFHLLIYHLQSIGNSEPLTLPQLRELDLSFNSLYGVSSAWFDLLVLPALESLSISHEKKALNFFTPWPCTGFQSLLSHSSGSIRALSLHNVSMSETRLVESLQDDALQSLTKLHLTQSPNNLRSFLGNLTFELLTLAHGASSHLPRLVDIKLHVGISSSDGALSSMIRSRFHLSLDGSATPRAHISSSLSRLERVDILIADEEHPLDVKSLGDLEIKGFPLHLSVL